VMSQDEVARFLAAVDNLKHRVILTVRYATGLRISAAVRLTPDAIDSRRMVIRVVKGKGRKDRYVMLALRLLQLLRDYWKRTRPGIWLFPGDRPDRPICPLTINHTCRRCAHSAVSTSRWHRTRCDTPSPFTCWRQAPTCAPSSCCSGTAI
jgi:integrase/recombinase XerD